MDEIQTEGPAPKKGLGVLASSKRDDWETPQAFFDKVNTELGPFCIDVCATAKNKKCVHYFGVESPLAEDGLTADWLQQANTLGLAPVFWMNPPYGRPLKQWLKKASEEALKGCLIACLMNNSSETAYYHDYIEDYFGLKPGVEVKKIPGRLTFAGAKNPNPRPSILVIFKPNNERGNNNG